MHNKIPLKASN